MNDNTSGTKIFFISFNSVNIKGKWAHLVEKKPQPGANISTIQTLIKMF